MDEAVWRRRLARQRAAREEAETLLETKSRALFEAQQLLRGQAEELERRVEERTAQLTAAHDALARANGARRAFLAQMSHELRTPLAAVVGYADLLVRTAAPGSEAGDWAAQLHRNAEHLLALVGDVLDLSRIEAGQLNLTLAPVDLRELLSDVDGLLRPRAAARGLDWALAAATALPAQITADRNALHQVLVNLGSNAIKYTPQGAVSLSLSLTDAGLRVDVRDSGIGIPPDELEGIWAPFARAKAARGGWYGGTGLGLAISRQLAEGLGGQLTATSQVGQGSTFKLRLPVTPAQRQTLLPAAVVRNLGTANVGPLPDLDGLRVLVVDDSADNRIILGRLLARAGAHVEAVSDGEAAVRWLTNPQAQVDVVLMDMQLPGMDGAAATRAVRKDGVTVPILALTADATPEARLATQSAGCDEHLVKPVRPADLYRTLANYSAPTPAPLGTEPTPLPAEETLPAWLAQAFFEVLRQRIEHVARSDDPLVWRREAGQLADAAPAYGFQALGEAARALADAPPDHELAPRATLLSAAQQILTG